MKRVIFFFVLIVFSPFVIADNTALRIGPQNFDFFLKGDAPTRPADFKVRTTGYWFALEEDYGHWYSTDKKDSFYHSVRMEGTGITKEGMLLNHQTIKTTKEASGVKKPDFALLTDPTRTKESKMWHPPYRPKRTLAVNLHPGTPCYIPRWSRVYIKYPKPNHPYTGWYIAEDTGGAFGGKCKIDVFMGVGDQYKINSLNPTVSAQDKSQWPEVWVYHPNPEDKIRAWKDNMYTYYLDPAKQKQIQAGTVSATSLGSDSSQTSSLSGVVSRPQHPAFSCPYTIDPSFSVSVPYDFSIYDNVTSKITVLERCLANISCIVGNVSKIEKEMGKYNWILKQGGNVLTKVDKQNIPKWYEWADKSTFVDTSKVTDGDSELVFWERFCEDPDTNAVNSLAEAISECTRSPQTDCICRYEIPVQENYLSKPGFFGLKKTEDASWKYRKLTIKNIGSGVQISSEKPSIKVTVPKAKFLFLDDSIKAEIYSKVTDISSAIDRLLGKKFKQSDTLIYSPSTKGYSLDIYKNTALNFSIYPEGKAPNTRRCELNNKVIKICVVGSNSFIGYDTKKDRYGLLPNSLKFAYLFKNKVEDVKNFVVSDAKLVQNVSLFCGIR